MNHYRPEGGDIPTTERPAGGFQAFYGGTHLGELWDLAPTGDRVEFEFRTPDGLNP